MECDTTNLFFSLPLFSVVTHRGYREKWLHKNLQKNKDGICKTLDSNCVSKPSFVNHLLQETVMLAQSSDDLMKTAEEAEEVEDSQDEQMECDDSKKALSEAAEKKPIVEAAKKMEEPLASPVDWDPFFAQEAVEIGRRILEYLEGMEVRLYDAHLQIKVMP